MFRTEPYCNVYRFYCFSDKKINKKKNLRQQADNDVGNAVKKMRGTNTYSVKSEPSTVDKYKNLLFIAYNVSINLAVYDLSNRMVHKKCVCATDRFYIKYRTRVECMHFFFV